MKSFVALLVYSKCSKVATTYRGKARELLVYYRFVWPSAKRFYENDLMTSQQIMDVLPIQTGVLDVDVDVGVVFCIWMWCFFSKEKNLFFEKNKKKM